MGYYLSLQRSLGGAIALQKQDKPLLAPVWAADIEHCTFKQHRLHVSLGLQDLTHTLSDLIHLRI